MWQGFFNNVEPIHASSNAAINFCCNHPSHTVVDLHRKFAPTLGLGNYCILVRYGEYNNHNNKSNYCNSDCRLLCGKVSSITLNLFMPVVMRLSIFAVTIPCILSWICTENLPHSVVFAFSFLPKGGDLLG